MPASLFGGTSTSSNVDWYLYTPSLDAAAVVAALYSLAFIGTLFQFMRYRSWVWTVMVLSSAIEAGGYITRCLSIKKDTNKNLYIVQESLIVLAPVLMAAACYVVFGRIVFHVVPKASRTTKMLWVPPRFVTPIFVVCDMVALFLQLVGVVQILNVSVTDPNAHEKAQKGKHIAQTGVAVQMICFGLFSVIAVRFNFTSKRFAAGFEQRLTDIDEKGKFCTVDGGPKRLKRNWQAILRVVNFASVMILIRSVYRMVDFSLGKTGYTERHEWVMYVFDALPIYPAVCLFIWWHPSKYLPYMGFRVPKHAR